ncbi:basic salivary proline-rich protein 2-like [Mus caroli]|uniref:Basic salivary proline-rich protein 2-like n=1 Tax=Mus caroli TaxID=10089 RepID=A0A6P5QNQ0_MUSCR|nr:basic salivary proline-rich protein 2-like [Mus caroli]
MDRDLVVCNPKEGLLEPSSAALYKSAATTANLTAPRCPRWRSQPGIPPPGRDVPTAPHRSPAWGFSPPPPNGKGSLGPSYQAVGIPYHPEWGRQSGVPPPGCGVSMSLVGAQYRVPPFGYGVPQVRKWDRSLGSLFATGGGWFPRPRVGAQNGVPSFGLNDSHSGLVPAPECQVQPPPNSPPPGRGASSSLQGSERATSGKARGPAAQRGKPRLAQGPPRHPFQTRDAGEPRGTRAPPDQAQHTAGRFVRSCHPKPAATPKRARVRLESLPQSAGQGASAALGCTGLHRTAGSALPAAAARPPPLPPLSRRDPEWEEPTGPGSRRVPALAPPR